MRKSILVQRLGGINFVKHKKYIKENYNLEELSYHAPPERFGLYVNPKDRIEYFLLSADITVNKSKFCRLDNYLNGKEKKRTLCVEGYIWVHIADYKKFKHLVIEEKGYWQKIHTKHYNKILRYHHAKTIKCNLECFSIFQSEENDKDKKEFFKNRYNTFRKTMILGDELEIFIPRDCRIKRYYLKENKKKRNTYYEYNGLKRKVKIRELEED